MSKVALFNHGVGPDLLHQLILVHHTAAVSDQHQKGFEDLRLERDRFTVSQPHPSNWGPSRTRQTGNSVRSLCLQAALDPLKKVKKDSSRRKRLSRAIRANVGRVVNASPEGERSVTR